MSEKTEKLFKGGAFLIEDLTGENVITPETYNEEHKMIAKTTEDLVGGEVLTLIDKLENHEFDNSVDLHHRAGELGLLSADIREEYSRINVVKNSSSLIQKM